MTFCFIIDEFNPTLKFRGVKIGIQKYLVLKIGVLETRVTSVLGTGLGIIQAQQSAQMQAAQAQQSMDMQYRQQQEQGAMANRQATAQYMGKVKAEQELNLSYQRQIGNINEAVNKSYTQEQLKLNEAKDKAAFKSQAILAKSIGAKGRILASGVTGQSVGLLANDAERQAGFATAQVNASTRSAETQAAATQDVAYTQAISSANQAFNRLAPVTQAPVLDPYGLQIETPDYQY